MALTDNLSCDVAIFEKGTFAITTNYFDVAPKLSLNVELHPDSWNVYDSYGEALLKNGQKEQAITMYRKSIDLNPGSKNGKKVLEELLKK